MDHQINCVDDRYLALRQESRTYLGNIATVGHQYLPTLLVSVRYMRLFAIAQAQMGLKLLSIIWNSWVSTVKGFWMY